MSQHELQQSSHTRGRHGLRPWPLCQCGSCPTASDREHIGASCYQEAQSGRHTRMPLGSWSNPVKVKLESSFLQRPLNPKLNPKNRPRRSWSSVVFVSKAPIWKMFEAEPSLQAAQGFQFQRSKHPTSTNTGEHFRLQDFFFWDSLPRACATAYRDHLDVWLDLSHQRRGRKGPKNHRVHGPTRTLYPMARP